MILEEVNPAETERPRSDTLLRTVEWFASYFSVPFSPETVKTRMPADYAREPQASLPRMLAQIGLRSAYITSSASEIDPAVLPCACFDKNDEPLVVKSVDRKAGTVTVCRFDEDTPKEVMLSDAEARQTLSTTMLMASLETDVLASRVDQSSQGEPTVDNRWFWKPIRAHWPSWLQIFIAAIGINVLGLALPIFVMNVYDRVIPNLAFITLWTLVSGIAVALVIDLLLKLMRTHVLEQAGRRIDLKIGSSIFRHALNVELLSRGGGTGTLASQIRDFDSVRDFFTSSSFVAVIDLLFIGLFVFVLWVIVGPIAIVPLVAVPIVIAIGLISQLPIGASIERLQKVSAKKQTVLIESLLGIETIKSLNGEPVMQREWDKTMSASLHILGRTKFWSNFAMNSTMFVQQLVSVTIIIWGVYLVSKGQISIGGLIAANILAGRVMAPLGNISQTIVRAQQALKSVRSISVLMNLPTDTPAIVQSGLDIDNANLEVKSVTFSYPQSPQHALSEFSLAVQPGETIGVLGRVGSGKTTLGKLLAGMISPEKGTVLVDDHEVGQYDKAVLRSAIGYLPQDPDIFTGTIRENLLMGRPDASEADIKRALYYSGMDYFVFENPEGLNQFVGEKGNRLSGGQRQSVGLARLLLRDTKLLFLDEPTNAMDNVTEALVTERLKELNEQGTTLIVSTHRMSLAKIMDRLIVIDQGRKVLDGERDDVLKRLGEGR